MLKIKKILSDICYVYLTSKRSDMFLEINTSLGHLILIYPLQILLLIILLVLGIYELYHFLEIKRFLSIGRIFGQRKYIKQIMFLNSGQGCTQRAVSIETAFLLFYCLCRISSYFDSINFYKSSILTFTTDSEIRIFISLPPKSFIV